MNERIKFFFPDSQDMVDPNFNFDTEEMGFDRKRHRSDAYAHELFERPPYDGMLVSKAIVNSRYSLGQQQRLFRLGVRKFLRLNDNIPIIGDCGAFSYKDMKVPPYTVQEVVEFYHQCSFTYGISMDHVILAYNEEWDDIKFTSPEIEDARRRKELTLNMAVEFFKNSSGMLFTPMGAAQGWSPKSYADSVINLQKMGYNYIAMGGFVPLRTPEILKILETVDQIRKSTTKLHLLGVTRLDSISEFKRYGVASFDSTSPFVQAFKSDKHNFHTPNHNYIAIRIPQVDANAKLKARILSGEVSQVDAINLERDCLTKMKAYAGGKISIDSTINSLIAYTMLHDQQLFDKPDKIANREKEYRETLQARPWEDDLCTICRTIGHHAIIFRGSERNRRRGFHNLDVFYRRLLATSL